MTGGTISTFVLSGCMAPVPPVEPPLLSEGSPDRPINCEVALEPAFEALVKASLVKGWSAQEIAETLLKLATEHAETIVGRQRVATQLYRWRVSSLVDMHVRQFLGRFR
ncbi:hypothetical protein AU467_16945 [Mesorhizobium loti]|uniref:Uncharacterized protein n=1 Tax=Rhizobium loti TaxID=381 RepID=A0A117N4H3_RHILI|nr:hypothetical protein AU467_16945 [Mesorhizobium loti]